MKVVTSKDNPVLKTARKLLSRKGREEEGAFLVEGRKLITEAAVAGFEIECVFVNAGALLRWETDAEGSNAGLGAANVERLGEAAKEWSFIALEEKLFCGLSETVSPQPWIAVVRRGDERGDAGTDDLPERILVLDCVGDPGNVGTMIRTALAAGMDEVWCTKGTADVFSGKAIRASAGAVFHMKMVCGLSATDCIEKVRGLGAKLVVCDARGANVFWAELTGRIAIVIGSESGGPSKAFATAADVIAGIPMSESSESLNAATASAIVMYEAKRQRAEANESAK